MNKLMLDNDEKFDAPFGLNTREARELEFDVRESIRKLGGLKAFDLCNMRNVGGYSIFKRWTNLFWRETTIPQGSWKQWLRTLPGVNLDDDNFLTISSKPMRSHRYCSSRQSAQPAQIMQAKATRRISPGGITTITAVKSYAQVPGSASRHPNAVGSHLKRMTIFRHPRRKPNLAWPPAAPSKNTEGQQIGEFRSESTSLTPQRSPRQGVPELAQHPEQVHTRPKRRARKEQPREPQAQLAAAAPQSQQSHARSRPPSAAPILTQQLAQSQNREKHDDASPERPPSNWTASLPCPRRSPTKPRTLRVGSRDQKRDLDRSHNKKSKRHRMQNARKHSSSASSKRKRRRSQDASTHSDSFSSSYAYSSGGDSSSSKTSDSMGVTHRHHRSSDTAKAFVQRKVARRLPLKDMKRCATLPDSEPIPVRTDAPYTASAQALAPASNVKGKGSASMDSGSRAKEATCQDADAFGVEQWLRELDAGNGYMLQYLEGLQREFEDLDQLAAAALPIKEGESIIKGVDKLVYEALGIKPLGHQLTFAKAVHDLATEHQKEWSL